MYTDRLFSDNDSQTAAKWDKTKVDLIRSGDWYWKGYIDELKLYNRTLTGTEINSLYESLKKY